MRFLLRAAFWFGLVMLLLPAIRSSGSGEKDIAPVGALEAASAASATFSDMRQFCTRQPGACAVGAQVATAAGQQAQAGAKLLYEMLSDQLAAGEPAGVATAAGTERRESAAPANAPRGTLTGRDLLPEWRGPARTKDVPQKRAPAES